MITKEQAYGQLKAVIDSLKLTAQERLSLMACLNALAAEPKKADISQPAKTDS